MLSCAHNSRGVGCAFSICQITKTGSREAARKKNGKKHDETGFPSRVSSDSSLMYTRRRQNSSEAREIGFFFYNNLGDGELSEMSFNMYI